MPLPGFNPIEQAPPPGSTEIAASAAQAARLHQRISDLERRLSGMETGRGTAWTPITGATYVNNWSAYGGAFGPYYRFEGRTVHLTGLVKPVATTASPNNMLILPDFLRPEPAPGGSGSAEFYGVVMCWNGSVYTTIPMYFYPRNNPSLAGYIVTPTFAGATSSMWCSLHGITYLRRSDM